MFTKNTYYTSKQEFRTFVETNFLKQNNSTLVQVFSSELKRDILEKVIAEILEVLPHAKLIGATTDGELLDNVISTDKIVVSVTLFEKATLEIALQDNKYGSYECGKELSKKIVKDDTKALILFSDGLTSNGEEFLDGVQSISSNIPLAGGMAGDATLFETTYVFGNDGVISQGAVGVSINAEYLNVQTQYSFNWQEIGKVLTITKAEANRVYEIDGQSAVDIYAKYLGIEIAELLPAVGIEFPLIITRNGMKIARAVLGKNDDGSLVFAGNLATGDKVHFGYGNSGMILKESQDIQNKFDASSLESIFVYSCMARRRFLEEAIALELQPLASMAPTAGFFTYGEFYIDKKSELLNQTMTIMAMSESKKARKYSFKDTVEYENISDSTTTHKALSHLIRETTYELKETNENLETLVEIKTKELQKKIEELENASKVKSDFLASMSHEIRTPLNAMLGFVDILKKDEKDKARSKYFTIIKNSGATLLTIINDILDFSKVESGKMILERRKFATKKPFKEVAMLFYEKAQENGIHLKVHFGDSLPRFFVGDVVRIKQVASNFLSNAIKFTKKDGEIGICVDFDDEKSLLVFSVEDDGIGIDKKNISKIFESFTQEDATTTRRFGGTGLGLSISKSLITAMKGRVDVQSTLGVGSKFSFSLPILEVDDIYKDRLSVEKIDFERQFDAKVLVVEDNKTNQMLMNILLEELGLEVDIAENGSVAVEKFKENKYDLIFMDENMPVMSGLEATKIILDMEEEKEFEHTPIIALTANALATDRAKFLSAGMDEFITKPVDNKVLIRAIHSFLAKEKQS